MLRFDVSCKHLLRCYPEHVLGLLRLPGEVVWGGALQSEVAAPPQVADAVARIRWNGVEYLVHLEFETRAKRILPQRMFWYNGTLSAKHRLPVYSVAVCLTPRRHPLPEAFETVYPNGQRLRLEYGVVRVWEEDAHATLARGALGVLPFVPLMHGADASTVREAVRRMTRGEPRAEERRELLAVTYLLAGLRFPERVLSSILRRSKMRDSVTYRSIKNEGRQEGLEKGLEKGMHAEGMEALLIVLEARFGDPSPALRRAVAKLRSTASLRSALREAAKAADLIAFRAWLQDRGPRTADRTRVRSRAPGRSPVSRPPRRR